MNNIWIYSLISVFIVSLISLVGLITFSFSQQKLKKIIMIFVSFSAGALLGGAFIHLLPEISNKQGLSLKQSLFILAGIIFFFILEKVICWRHCHLPSSQKHPHYLGVMNLVGDGFHNFIDGSIISAAFMVDFSLGLSTVVAVSLHEIPQEIGDFSVLIYAGFSKNKALFLNFVSALTAILGAFFTLLLGQRFSYLISFLVPFTAGGFIYIASADLIPELKKELGIKKSIWQLSGLLLGILLMFLIK